MDISHQQLSRGSIQHEKGAREIHTRILFGKPEEEMQHRGNIKLRWL